MHYYKISKINDIMVSNFPWLFWASPQIFIHPRKRKCENLLLMHLKRPYTALIQQL